MANLTKRDMVVRISNETGLIQERVQEIIQHTLDQLMESLARGQTVELRNFGVFQIKFRKARVGRNPNRPERDVPIPARAVVKFKAGKVLKAKVKNLSMNGISSKTSADTDSGRAQSASALTATS